MGYGSVGLPPSLEEFLLHVHWLVPIAIYIPIAYVGVRWLGKHLANRPNPTQKLVMNFSFGAAVAGCLAFFTGNLTISWLVLAIGVCNGVANIFSWKATRTSLSETSLLSFGDDIIAILLAVIIVGDGKYVNVVSGLGMMLCLATGILFWWHSWKAKGRESSVFYRNVLIYSLMWGIVDFAIRYFALKEMPVLQFVWNFYLGSLCLLLSRYGYEKVTGTYEKTVKMSVGEVALVGLFMLGIGVCLAVEYWARILAPQTAVQPILLVAEAIFPTFVGMIVYKERASFDRAKWAFTALGITGTCLIALGLHIG